MMSRYQIAYTARFKKQRRQLQARGFALAELDTVIALLAEGTPLPEKYRDHALQGTRKGYRDCHIRPNWVLVYKIEEDILTLLLCETGTHADLFG